MFYIEDEALSDLGNEKSGANAREHETDETDIFCRRRQRTCQCPCSRLRAVIDCLRVLLLCNTHAYTCTLAHTSLFHSSERYGVYGSINLETRMQTLGRAALKSFLMTTIQQNFLSAPRYRSI